MSVLIDYHAMGEPDLLETEEVCPSCHLAKHRAAFAGQRCRDCSAEEEA